MIEVAAGGGCDAFPPETGSVAEIKQDYEATEKTLQPRLMAKMKEARTDAEKAGITEDARNFVRWTMRRAQSWAQEHPNAPEAIDLLIWSVQNVVAGYYPWYDDEITHSYELLTKMGAKSDRIGPLCYGAYSTSYSNPAAEQFLRTVLDSNPDRTVRGLACLSIGRHYRLISSLARKLKDPILGPPLEAAKASTPHGFLEGLKKADPEALDVEAGSYFDRVVKEYPDVTLPEPYSQTPIGELARGELFKLKNLVVGKPAPEIEGTDLDGHRLRLSDYRGKVVALVFWATWCGPCMANVPKERAMVKRLETKPFVLLGVNGDAARATARDRAKAEPMTWRSWWDGERGPIAVSWAISSWPTHYLIDPKGIVRYENPQGPLFEQAIDRLVDEALAAHQ